MKKHSGASAQHQVIEIIEESKEEIKNNCYVKAATVLGVVQIICGIVALVIWILEQDNNTISFGNGIWTFTLFFFSGLLTIRVVERRNKWLIAASMVMSINSAVSAGCLLIKAGIGSYSDIYYGGISDYSNYRYVADVVKVVMAWTMLMAGTASVLLTAFTHLCPTSGQPKLRESGRFVHFNSSQLDLTNHQDLHISRVQLNSSFNLDNLQDLPKPQPSLDEPPTYQEVTGLRENC